MRYIIFFLCLHTPLWAVQLVGRVVDAETQKPVANASVRIHKAAVATQTDGDGRFAFLDLSLGPYTLAISHVAYDSVERAVQATETGELLIALSPKTLSLDELSVIADPIGTGDIYRHSAYATVITREHFDGRETSLPDVLAEAVGVQVKRLGGLGAFSAISLRGSSADQVEVYLDGMLLNAAVGGGVDLGNLPLAHVGQIEIYRGAGGNGLGGAVHVRTRPTAEQGSREIRGSWGSFDTRSLSGAISGGVGQSRFLAVADYAHSDNDFGFLDDNGTEYNADDDAWRSRQNNAHLSVNFLGKWRHAFGTRRTLAVQETAYWKRQGIPGIGNNQSQNAQLRAFRTFTEIAYEDRALLRGITLRQSLYFTHTKERFRDLDGEIGIGRQDNDYRTRTYGWRGQIQTVLLSRGDIAASLDLHRETYLPTTRIGTSVNLFDSQRWIASARARLDIPLPRNIGLWSFGAEQRRIHSSFTGANPFNFSPLAPDSTHKRDLTSLRSGVRFDLTPNTMLKANAGRVFRVPSFYELFGDRGGIVGNVDLVPERGRTWDAGLRYADETTELEGAYFDHRYENLIQFVHTSQATARPVNIGNARVHGLEFTAQKRFGDHVNLSGNYTFQRAEDKSDIPHLSGNTLPNRPPHALFARIATRMGRCTVFYDYTFEDGNFLDRANRRPLSARHIHNAGVKIPVERWVRIGLEAKNLSGSQIADTWGYPLPGRAFFISISTGGTTDEHR